MEMDIAGRTGEAISFEIKNNPMAAASWRSPNPPTKILRLCRTPHVCVGTLVLVTFLQCGLSVWHYSQPVPATFQENGWGEEVRRS